MADTLRSSKGSRVLARGGVILSGGIALFVLASWGLGAREWAGVATKFVPTAPGSALVILSLAAALALRSSTSANRWRRLFSLVFAGLAALGSAAVCLHHLVGAGFSWEKWLVSAAAGNGFQIGRMSPFSGGALFLPALSLLIRPASSASRTWLRRAGEVATAVSALFCTVVVLSYASGTPLFYGQNVIPIALLTAVAVLALDLGILADRLAALARKTMVVPAGTSTPNLTEWQRLAALGGIAALAITILGVVYLRTQQATLRETILHELAAIADLKKEQIEQWRSERLADAHYLNTEWGVARAVAESLLHPDDATRRRELLDLLGRIKEGNAYASMVVFDGQGRPRMQIPADAAPDAAIEAAVRQTLATKSPTDLDLAREAMDAPVYWTLVAPVTGVGNAPDAAPLGAIAVRVNAATYLFPMIQRWPIPSATAESLLVKREGDEVVYLNEIRHRSDTALRLRRPVADRELVAAMAARSEANISAGRDYRGIPVLAAVRPIRNSPWILVAKVDEKEVYAPLRRQAVAVSLAVLALVAAIVLGVELNWRKVTARLLMSDIVRRQAQEKEIRRLNRLYLALSQVNQAVVRAATLPELLETVCRAIAEHAKFPLVWIGQRDESAALVKPVVAAGPYAGSLERFVISTDDTPEGRGPTGTAVREGRGVVCNDFATDPRINPWREIVAELGFQSAAAFPISRQNQVWGSLTVFASEKDFFRDNEMALLAKTTDEISFAISRMDEMAEKLRGEEALRASEEKYRALIETTGTGYVFLDSDGFVRGANQEYVRLSGRSTLDEIMGHKVEEWTATHDRERNALEVAKCRRLGFVRNLEIDYVDREGKITPVEINATVVGTGPESLIITLCRDITERRLAAEQNRRLELQVQQAQKMEGLGVLAGGIAHDFNNILTAISGHAGLAIAGLTTDSPARVDLLAIEKAVRRAAELCQQMLAYAGRGQLAAAPVNLTRLVGELTHLLEISLSKKTLLLCRLDEKLPTILANPTQLRQVAMNLVINAAEAIGDNEGVVTVSTGVVECDEAYLRADSPIEPPLPGSFVYLEVTDSGCGMDEITQGRIFDPFFTTKFAGRGLGLAAALGIVRSHKGSLKLRSGPGKGTTFRVLFPLTKAGPLAPSREGADSNATLWRGAGTILLADDEESVRLVAVKMLTHCGFNVIEARDGQEAVECFQLHASEVVCVVLDLTMPRLNGIEACSEIRRIRPGTRVILASGYNDREVTTRFLRDGATEFLQKPYELSSLSAVLRDLLTRSVALSV